MDSIKIREASLSDAFNLVRLIVPEFAKRTNEDLAEGKYVKKWLENYEMIVHSSIVTSFVAIDSNNELVGVLTVYLLPRLELAGYYSVIEDVFVKESERSKGIGSLLFKEAIKYLKSNGCRYVTLNVARDNDKAQSFYRKLGFKTEALEMRLDLIGPERS